MDTRITSLLSPRLNLTDEDRIFFALFGCEYHGRKILGADGAFGA